MYKTNIVDKEKQPNKMAEGPASGVLTGTLGDNLRHIFVIMKYEMRLIAQSPIRIGGLVWYFSAPPKSVPSKNTVKTSVPILRLVKIDE